MCVYVYHGSVRVCVCMYMPIKNMCSALAGCSLDLGTRCCGRLTSVRLLGSADCSDFLGIWLLCIVKLDVINSYKLTEKRKGQFQSSVADENISYKRVSFLKYQNSRDSFCVLEDFCSNAAISARPGCEAWE